MRSSKELADAAQALFGKKDKKDIFGDIHPQSSAVQSIMQLHKKMAPQVTVGTPELVPPDQVTVGEPELLPDDDTIQVEGLDLSKPQAVSMDSDMPTDVPERETPEAQRARLKAEDQPITPSEFQPTDLLAMGAGKMLGQ
jgi:hypothetical protein